MPPHHNFFIEFLEYGIFHGILNRIPKKIHHNKNIFFLEYRIFQEYSRKYSIISHFFYFFFLVFTISFFFPSQHFFAVYWNMEYFKQNASQYKKLYFWNMKYSTNFLKKYHHNQNIENSGILNIP